MDEVGRCGENGRSRASHWPTLSRAVNGLTLCGIAPPFANALSIDYTPIVILAVVLFLIAVIVLAVPALSDYLRRWRENREIYLLMHPSEPREPSPNASEQIARMTETKDGARDDALGWSAEENVNRAAEAPNHLSVERDAVVSGNKTILIADDDPVVVQALSRRLQHMGYQVFRSPDAAHALMGAMKVRPNLVILDVNMPAGNGLAVCEMMASDPRYAGIPVIIHSVIGDEATKERCKRLGAYHVEKSPRSWSAIKELVESLIGGEKRSPESQPPTIRRPPEMAPPPRDESWAGGQVESRGAEEPQARQDRVAATSAEPPVAEEIARGRGRAPLPAEPPAAEKPAQVRRTTPLLAESLNTFPACGRPRVLCIESPKDRLEFVEHQLSALGIEVTRTSDLEEGFWTCFTEKPQVVIVQASGSAKALQDLLTRLSQHPVTRTLPVLLIDENDVIARSGLSAAVNLRVLKFPMDWEDLLGELETILPVFGRHEEEGILMKIADSNRAEGATEETPVATVSPSAVSDDGEKPLKVLCIDDDPVVARSIAMRLQPYGITMISASNGTQGHLMAVTEQPDLILLDLKMPKGEGNYVLSKLKEGDRTDQIPVIILTIESNPGVARQLMSMGAAAFLSKPIHWSELFEAMARCVKLPKQLLADYKISRPLTLAEL
jgi:CheY-like chemotaxis protein